MSNAEEKSSNMAERAHDSTVNEFLLEDSHVSRPEERSEHLNLMIRTLLANL